MNHCGSISNIPQDIDVVASDESIVVAFVSSEQINQLAQLDFVNNFLRIEFPSGVLIKAGVSLT